MTRNRELLQKKTLSVHRDSAQEASVDDILCYRPNKNVLLKKKVRTSDLFLTRETFCRFIAEPCHFVVFFATYLVLGQVY